MTSPLFVRMTLLRPTLLWFSFGALLLAGLTGCSRWNLVEKEFPICTEPSAKINYQAQQLSVAFSLSTVSGTIDRVVWDFGNGKGATTTELKTSYSYSTPGAYTVVATLSNKCGDETAISRAVTISDVTPPVIATLAPGDIGLTTATLRLNLTNAGKGAIVRSGLCYSAINRQPTPGDTIVLTINPAAAGIINSLTVNNLLANTTYYARAFAENSAGIGYGDPVSFRTLSLATVTTGLQTIAARTSATVAMQVEYAGNPVATTYGICYSATNTQPTIGNDRQTTDNPTTGILTAVLLTNLLPDTRYSYRAFATSSAGTAYGDVQTLTTQADVDINKGLVAYYPLNGNANDFGGNNLNGTLLNGPVPTLDRRGNANSAIDFDGIDDYLEIADNALLRSNNLTVSFWVKLTNRALNTQQHLFIKTNWTDAQAEQYSALIKVGSGNFLVYNFDMKQNSSCQTGQGWRSVSGISDAPVNAWHHLSYTYQGHTSKIYLDGKLIGTNDALPLTDVIDNCAGGALRFAAQSQDYPEYLNGILDDIRVYNRALSESEINALFKQ